MACCIHAICAAREAALVDRGSVASCACARDAVAPAVAGVESSMAARSRGSVETRAAAAAVAGVAVIASPAAACGRSAEEARAPDSHSAMYGAPFAVARCGGGESASSASSASPTMVKLSSKGGAF